MKTKIFIIAGKTGTGKNEVAKILKEIYQDKNKTTINVAYASYLKEYAKNILGWNGNEQTKPRDFLQHIGVDIVKKIDSKMLIHRVIEDIQVYSHYFDIITISDARFKEEIEDVKHQFPNVVVIHILEKDNNLTQQQKQHVTETALDHYNNYDYEISNNGTIEELKQKLVSIVKEVEYE